MARNIILSPAIVRGRGSVGFTSFATPRMEMSAGWKHKRLSRRAAIRIASAAIGNISKKNWKKETIIMTKGTVVIAGATNELGKALAKHYVDKGHRVVVSSRTMERAEALAN